jgi:hypothetical protein
MSSSDPNGEELLRAWIQEFAAAPLAESKALDPGFIWWKGELMRRLDAQQKTTAWLDFGERACAGIGMAAALALGIYLFRADLPPVLLLATVTALALLLGVAVFALSFVRTGDGS